MSIENGLSKPKQFTAFNLSRPIDLLKKDRDPRKTQYFLGLIINTREYWHKLIRKNGTMYSPSIFRLLKAEGLLDKKDDGARIHGAPEHIVTVMSGCTALAQLIKEKIGLSEKDINDLLLAAAVHDVNKDIEIDAIKMTIEDNMAGFGQKGYDLASKVSEQKLKFAGVPENIIKIHNMVGHTSCPEIEKMIEKKSDLLDEEEIKKLIIHYLDDIVVENTINPEITQNENGQKLNALDRRCIQNENNPTYTKYNFAWINDQRNKTGETAFQMQRRVGHLVEEKLAELLDIKDPLSLPSVIYSQIQKNIQENWDKK